MGEQETFEEDTLDPDVVLERAQALANTVFRRFVGAGFAAFHTVTVTVRFTGFVTVNRSGTGKLPLTTPVGRTALSMLGYQRRRRLPVSVTFGERSREGRGRLEQSQQGQKCRAQGQRLRFRYPATKRSLGQRCRDSNSYIAQQGQ